MQDDHRDEEIKFEDLAPNEPNSHISYDNIKILLGKKLFTFCFCKFYGYDFSVLETLENEIAKLVSAAKQIDGSVSCNIMPALQPMAVIQSVKLIAKIMGTVVTSEVTEAIDSFEQVCRDFIQFRSEVSKNHPPIGHFKS